MRPALFKFNSFTDKIYFQGCIKDGYTFKELQKYLQQQGYCRVPIHEIKLLVLHIAKDPFSIRTDRISALKKDLQKSVKLLFKINER